MQPLTGEIFYRAQTRIPKEEPEDGGNEKSRSAPETAQNSPKIVVTRWKPTNIAIKAYYRERESINRAKSQHARCLFYLFLFCSFVIELSTLVWLLYIAIGGHIRAI